MSVVKVTCRQTYRHTDQNTPTQNITADVSQSTAISDLFISTT